MVLTGSENDGSNPPALIRGTWHVERGGSVRETAEQSIDGRKTWSLVFDIEFRHSGK